MAESSLSTHQCTACKEVKLRSEFYSGRRGWVQQPCKPCHIKLTSLAAKRAAIKRGKLCGCGCGEIVIKKNSRFCQGHATRTSEYARVQQNLNVHRWLGGKPSKFNAQGFKQCTGCLETKPLEEFYQKKLTLTNGRASQFPSARCKGCHSKICKDYAKRNKDAVAAYRRMWAELNAEKRRQQKREHKKRRPEHYKLESKAWRYKRKSKGGAGYNRTLKAIKEAVSFTLDQYRIGDKYLDVYSGELIDKPTIDHIVPIDQGGDNSAENMCVTSVANNSSKHHRSLLNWLVWRANQSRNS